MTAKPPVKDDRHILVVDDDEHTRGLLKVLCESTGYKVSTAEDGQVALDRIASGRPDLVLLDLMMPRRDGFSVLRTVRENTAWADLPIILLTAMGDMDGKIRGMELGADDYATKPFSPRELVARVRAVLRRGGAVAEQPTLSVGQQFLTHSKKCNYFIRNMQNF